MVTVVATGLLMAGCGDDEDETPTQPAAGGGGTEVVLTEFEIDPANPTAKPGPTTFEVVNEGSAPHALEIEGAGIEEKTKTLSGGGRESLTVELTAGEYKWYCPVGNHADQGMEGTLPVE